jgi:hypothetical protein
MESSPIQTHTKYQPVTVDVPEERVAEFHAFFARFLAGRSGRSGRPGGPRGRHGRPHGGRHGRHCAGRREATERDQATGQPNDISEV